jgi:hypothetical protein
MPEKTLLEQLLPWAPYIGTLGGALITGLVAIGLNSINKRSEERRYMRELVLKTSIEHFKIACSKTGPGQRVAPLEAFIIHLAKISEVLMETKITSENILRKLKDAHTVSAEVEAFIKVEEAETKAKKAAKEENEKKEK